MSLEEDMVQAAEELIQGDKQQIAFLASISSDTPLEARVDGSSNPIPCIRTDATEMTIGKQVVLLKVGPKFYVVGALGTYVPPEIPDVPESKVFSDIASANTNYGTSNTVVMSVPLTVGEWSIEVRMGHQWVGSTDQIGRLVYSGTTSMASFDFTRITVSSFASEFGLGLATDMNFDQTSGATQRVIVSGGLVATTDGTLDFTMRRVAGTSALVRAGASLIATKV